MAQLPTRLRGQPTYQELRRFMRGGICTKVALGCKHLRKSPRVQGSLSTSSKKERTESEEAQALVNILIEETSSATLAGATLSTHSLRLLFPEDETEELLTERRRAITKAEAMSDSTLTRREFAVCMALLAALGLPGHEGEADAEREGARDPRIDGLEGDWFAVWQTTVHGSNNFNMEKINISRVGGRLKIENESPSPHNPEGYLWRGTLEAVQERVLVGAYAAVDPATGWSGTLYYQVGGSGSFMEGRWVGANVDSSMNTGMTVLARSQDVARRRFAFLVGGSDPIPTLD